MSQENVDIVRAGFEAWNSGGVDAVLELLDLNVEWTVRPDLPDAGVYRGHAELGQLFARFDEVLEDQWIEPQEFIDAGERRVIVPLHWGGPGRRSGVEMSERQGETWVFTVESGKVIRVTEYRDEAEVLESVGHE